MNAPDLETRLASVATSAVPDELRTRLISAADRDQTLALGYDVVDSPVGPLLLVSSPSGLLRVAFVGEGHESVLEALAERIDPRIIRHPARVDPVRVQLEEYFEGRRLHFDLDFDLRLARGFRLDVLGELQRIGYGQRASYAAVAAATGRPAAVRAVGTACATNPLPLVIPCHRVVRSDGTIGNYGGGSEAKQLLLDLEAG